MYLMPLVRLLPSLLCLAVVLMTGELAPCRAQDPLDPTSAFKDFVAARQAALSNLKSFEMKGSLKVTVSDDELAANGGSKITERTFHVWAKGDGIQEFVERLDDAGKVESTTTYYLTSKQVIEVEEQKGERAAKIFTLGKAPNTGLFNECPAFLEYSFLGLSINDYGFPALPPSALVSSQKWQGVFHGLEGVSSGKDGSVRASLSTKAGSSTLDLTPVPDAKGGYQIRELSFFSKDKFLDRKIEVLDFFHDKEFGAIGTKFRVGVYRSAPGKPPIALWEFSIDDVQLNCPVDDAQLRFEPDTVDYIFYGDTQQSVKLHQ